MEDLKKSGLLHEVRPSRGLGKLFSMKLLYFLIGMGSLLSLGYWGKLDMVSAGAIVTLTVSFGTVQGGQDISHAISNAIIAKASLLNKG